jgi:AcrR family transcriptional regulator
MLNSIGMYDSMRKNNREKIIEAARQLLPKYGYNGISIREIAAKSRLTTGAIYFHFKNKKEIYKNICIEAIDTLIREFKKRIKDRKTPNQKLISTYDAYIQFFNEHRDYYNILMEYKADYESKQGIEENEVAQKMREMSSVMEEIIRQGIQEGAFRKLDPAMLSLFLASVTEGMLQYKKLGFFKIMGVSDRNFRTFMAEVVGRGIMKE